VKLIDVTIVSCDGRLASGDVVFDTPAGLETLRVEAALTSGRTPGVSLSWPTPDTAKRILRVNPDVLFEIHHEFLEAIRHQRDLLRELN
jgi:hypothetical protein